MNNYKHQVISLSEDKHCFVFVRRWV